ncbi:LOW QUALITY PROTEIN: hypothetical protein Cgig2_014229 [Carnegiea gigantea]|uniref:Uncharacterized protein n=1 Tax=Carnegiea gigantea TaxID=171969 RepID=A0A9Q1Q9X9_9CARY|nr:LOW QUALITY PROTEIN: hypothetical protein Cgig2_014229 [Carnegiea gigantea]
MLPKGRLDELTSTIGGTRVKHTSIKFPISRKKQKGHKKGLTEEPQVQTPTPTPTLTSADTHIPFPTSTTQKPQSHDTTPIFNVNNEHVPEWDWEGYRPESPILWDKLVEGDSLNKGFGDSEYVLKTKVDLEAFEDITGSISKKRDKRKINNDGDQHDLDTDVQDEWKTDVEDLETSDEKWAVARAMVTECKKQKVSGRIDTAEQVDKQDMAVDKSTTAGIE